MRNITKTLILSIFLASSLGFIGIAFAYSPYLSVSGSAITISGAQPNAAVVITYMPSGSNLNTTITGTTDYNGYFSAQASSVTSQVSATVGGQPVYAYNSGTGGCGYYGCGSCTYNCGSTYGLSLSQTSASLSVGQSVAITAYNSGYSYNSNALYVSSNSNSSVASASANGSQVTIYGIASGTATISICQNSGSAGCASVYVTVSGSSCTYYGCNNGNAITLSPSSLNLTSPQTASVSIVGSIYNSGAYYVSSNSTPNVASASVSGNTLYVNSLFGGSTTITVCQSGNSSACATLYVTVNGGSCSTYGCGGSGTISLSQTTLNLSVGQSQVVSAYNSGAGSPYISNNTNSSVVSASVLGSQITFYAIANGSATVSVCAYSSSQCASVYVTVSGSSCTYYGCGGSGTLSLSQTSLSLTSGQSATVTAYNVPSLYVSSNSTPGVVNVTINSLNQAIFYAQGNGSSTVILCGISSTQCASVYVTVNGYGSVGGSGILSFSPSSVNINLGQSATVSIYNSYYYSGSYYISSNSNSSIASASISGSSIYLLAGGVGSTSIIVCQSGLSSCGTLYVTVSSVGGSLSLSQSNVSLSSGQNVVVTAYGTGSGIYISSNSNPIVAGYSISGNQINITASGVGSTTLNVCSNSGYGCVSLYVTVSGSSCGYYGCGSGTLSLSQTSLSLGVGQTSAITIYGNGSYYVSSNSNSYVASGLLAGNIINVTALQNGTTNIYICQNGSGSTCATLYVTVGGTSYYGTTNVVLSPSSLNLSVGQTASVNASGNGGYGYYLSTNSNPGVVSASFNGSVLTVYAITNGTSALQICQNGASACANLTVNVGTAYGYSGGTGTGGVQYPGSGSSVLGASTYPNGELISEGQTVYIVYRGTKTAFSSASVFTGLGFSFSNVVAVGNSGLPSSGHIISTSKSHHPWGSWIKNGTTVYFVQESGLIPVPDWATFLNNGGSANTIVNSNFYDFGLPILSAMTSNDSRLR